MHQVTNKNKKTTRKSTKHSHFQMTMTKEDDAQLMALCDLLGENKTSVIRRALNLLWHDRKEDIKKLSI